MKTKKNKKIVLITGLPGSGKTYFSELNSFLTCIDSDDYASWSRGHFVIDFDKLSQAINATPNEIIYVCGTAENILDIFDKFYISEVMYLLVDDDVWREEIRKRIVKDPSLSETWSSLIELPTLLPNQLSEILEFFSKSGNVKVLERSAGNFRLRKSYLLV